MCGDSKNTGNTTSRASPKAKKKRPIIVQLKLGNPSDGNPAGASTAQLLPINPPGLVPPKTKIATDGASGSSISIQPKTSTLPQGVSPAAVSSTGINLQLVTTRTSESTPAYSAFREEDPDNPGITLQYENIAATPSYVDMSSEVELRVRDYQQNCKTADASDCKLFVPVWDQQRPTSTGAFAVPSTADAGKEERMEEFVRKFFLGVELVSARFHLFSVRSSSSRRISKLRVLCTNTHLLANGCKYFSDLLNSNIDPSDPSFTELADDNDAPRNICMDDYGYGSDSDLDDYDDPIPEMSKVHPSKRKRGKEYEGEDVDKSDGGSESVQGSNVSVVNAKLLRRDTQSRTSGGRSILVKDVAFQTWYALLNYLSTGKVSFSPLSSAMPGKRLPSFTSWSDRPRCSAKSMYRLACKIELNDLRDQALAHIRSNLNEHNILSEIACGLVSSHPRLLDMELDSLYSYISTPAVAANFPTLLRRIANKEVPHGADIMINLHSRFLGVHRPISSLFAPTFSGTGAPQAAPHTPLTLASSSVNVGSSTSTMVVQEMMKRNETTSRATETDAHEFLERRSSMRASVSTSNEPARKKNKA